MRSSAPLFERFSRRTPRVERLSQAGARRIHQLGKKSSKRTLLNLLSRPQGSARRFRPRALLILERRTTRRRRAGRDTPSIANSPARFGGSRIVSSIGSFFRPRRTTVNRIHFRRYSKSSTRIASIGAIVEASFFQADFQEHRQLLRFSYPFWWRRIFRLGLLGRTVQSRTPLHPGLALAERKD
jgi:hypothetical protein